MYCTVYSMYSVFHLMNEFIHECGVAWMQSAYDCAEMVRKPKLYYLLHSTLLHFRLWCFRSFDKNPRILSVVLVRQVCWSIKHSDTIVK